MKLIRILFALCALALSGALIAGCGGDDDGGSSDADPQTVLENTFNNDTKVSSGNLTISVNVDAQGDEGGSFEGSLSGPFQGDPDNAAAIPMLDWTAEASGDIAGQSLDFEGGLVITEDNAFIEYGDKAYEIGSDQFAPLKEQLESQAGAANNEDSPASFKAACSQALKQAGATDTKVCDVDFTSWLTNLTNEGTEDVGGAESVHVHGDANLDRVLEDVGNFAAAIPAASAQGFNPAQLQLLEGMIDSASIDVYSTTDDNLLSKLQLNLGIDLAGIPESERGGVEKVDVTFGFEIAEINEEQSVEAPGDAEPIDSLLGDLGIDLGQLGQLGGVPEIQPRGDKKGGGKQPNADAYLECIQQAQTADAINECASEL